MAIYPIRLYNVFFKNLSLYYSTYIIHCIIQTVTLKSFMSTIYPSMIYCIMRKTKSFREIKFNTYYNTNPILSGPPPTTAPSHKSIPSRKGSYPTLRDSHTHRPPPPIHTQARRQST